MTKEKIIDAVLNSKVLEIYNKQDCMIYVRGITEEILSVCSKGIIAICSDENTTLMTSFIPFEKVAKIVISKEEVIE